MSTLFFSDYGLDNGDKHKSFYDSWIANHPRRTGEAYFNQYIWARFIEENPLPKDADFPELWDWFDKLREVEEGNSA